MQVFLATTFRVILLKNTEKQTGKQTLPKIVVKRREETMAMATNPSACSAVVMLYTTQNRTVPIIFPVIIQAMIIAQMMSTGGNGVAEKRRYGIERQKQQQQLFYGPFSGTSQGWQVSASTGLNLGLNRFKPSWQKQVSTRVSATFGRNCFLTELLSHFLSRNCCHTYSFTQHSIKIIV